MRRLGFDPHIPARPAALEGPTGVEGVAAATADRPARVPVRVRHAGPLIRMAATAVGGLFARQMAALLVRERQHGRVCPALRVPKTSSALVEAVRPMSGRSCPVNALGLVASPTAVRLGEDAWSCCFDWPTSA
jgi:hypothetical protein